MQDSCPPISIPAPTDRLGANSPPCMSLTKKTKVAFPQTAFRCHRAEPFQQMFGFFIAAAVTDRRKPDRSRPATGRGQHQRPGSTSTSTSTSTSIARMSPPRKNRPGLGTEMRTSRHTMPTTWVWSRRAYVQLCAGSCWPPCSFQRYAPRCGIGSEFETPSSV